MKNPPQKNANTLNDSLKESPDLDAKRKAIRKHRSMLSQQDRQQLSLQIFKQTVRTDLYQQAAHVALYLSSHGEVETERLIEDAQSSNKKVYLPVLDPNDKTRMYFVEYQTGDRLIESRFGMLEPELRSDKTIPPEQLDLVLCPLVAFDAQANRVGMGGGFYDRHFAFKNEAEFDKRPPVLVGLAYEFQKVDAIDPAPWDVPMSAVVSENEIYLPPKN